MNLKSIFANVFFYFTLTEVIALEDMFGTPPSYDPGEECPLLNYVEYPEYYQVFTEDNQQGEASSSSGAKADQSLESVVYKSSIGQTSTGEGTSNLGAGAAKNVTGLEDYLKKPAYEYLKDHKLTLASRKRKCVGCYHRQNAEYERSGVHREIEKISTKCEKCKCHFCQDCFDKKHLQNINIALTKDYDFCPHCQEYLGSDPKKLLEHTGTCTKVFRDGEPGTIERSHYKYACVLCACHYQDKAAMRNHLPKHTKETPHPCPICGHFFTQRSSVYRHIRTMHDPPKKQKSHTDEEQINKPKRN